MSDIKLDFDKYCVKFELSPEDKSSKEMYDVYTENFDTSEENAIFNANSDVNAQGRNAIFD